MDYVIKNYKNLYIKLNANGKAETCSDKDKDLFDYHKARNVCDNLPKLLKSMKFVVKAVPDITQKEDGKADDKKTLNNYNYVPSENITRWIDKFGVCGDILNEAKEREQQLIKELNETDNELLDILHIIEIDKDKDLFGGWKLYKQIRDNRKRRRDLKDEILIVKNVLREITDYSCFQRKRIKRAIDGLFTRKYAFRVVEEENR